MKTEFLSLTVEGVRVRVRLDERGRPLSVTPEYRIGGTDDERIIRMATLAAEAQIRQARGAAERKAKAASDATRTAESAKTRRKNARKHFSHAWLQSAYNGHPGYGAKFLAAEARDIAKLNRVDKDKRDKITEYRAKQFLKAKRSA